MRNNSVIIATNAEFLAGLLREKLQDAGLCVFIADNDNDLAEKIKAMYPRHLFIEHCFYGSCTDCFVQKTVRKNRDVRITVWAASELKPIAAARFIAAGAESFFSLRDSDSKIETIVKRIAAGRHYYPVEVEEVLDMDCAYPLIGEELTQREIQIIKLSTKGQSNKQIGDVLSLSVHTVKFHKANIYRKCGGNTAVDILRNGMIRGIITREDLE